MIDNAKIAFYSFFLSWTWFVILNLKVSENVYAKYILISSIALHFWIVRKSVGDLIQVNINNAHYCFLFDFV